MAGSNFLAYIRGVARAVMAEGPDAVVHATSGGELLVAQGLPSEAEISRQGAGWMTIGAAVAPVAVIPTTAAHFSLYNKSTTKSMIIAAVGSFNATSMGVAGQCSLLVRNDVPGVNADPAGVLIITGTAGANQWSAADGNAKASVTLAAIGAGNNVAWVPAGPSISAVTTTTVGLNAHYECYGRYIVRPGGLFSLATLAQTAVGTAQPYIKFYTAVLPLP